MSIESEWASPRAVTKKEQLLVMAATIVLGCALYRPWVPAPFDLLDFSEFIPRLATARSPGEAFTRLFEYYLGHGRVNAVVYVVTVAKWSGFGDWTPGWQGVRVLLFVFVVREAYLLYTKVGATRSGAALGSAVFLVAPIASPGWIRLSVAEPLGTLFVLWASNLAVDARRGTAPRTAGLQIAILTLLLGLTKEMMLVCLVIPVAMYWWPAPKSSPRGMAHRLRFLAPTIIAAFVASAIVVWGYLQTNSSGYAAEYGSTHSALWEVIPPWLFSFFPYDPFAGGAGALFTVLTVAYVSILAVGWRLYLKVADVDARKEAKAWLIIALLFPALIALEYLPWPVFNRFYYFPAVITLGGLVAVAVTGFDRANSVERWTTVAVLVACCSAGALQARAASDRSFAARKVVGSMVRFLGSVPPVDTIFVGARIVANQSWQGLPETIRRYGPVVGVTLPPVIGTSCTEGEAAAREGSRNVAFLGFATACRAPLLAARTVKEQYHRFDFGTLRRVRDSVRIDLVVSRPGGGSR